MIQYYIDNSNIFNENKSGIIYLYNSKNNDEIGHLEFSDYISYDEDDEFLSSNKFIELMENIAEILLVELYIYEKYRCNGFANILLEYFVNTYIKDKVCVLEVHAFGHNNSNVCNFYNINILPKLYGKYGFKKFMKSNYMVRYPSL